MVELELKSLKNECLFAVVELSSSVRNWLSQQKDLLVSKLVRGKWSWLWRVNKRKRWAAKKGKITIRNAWIIIEKKEC